MFSIRFDSLKWTKWRLEFMFWEPICQSGAQFNEQIHPGQRACTCVLTETHLTACTADRQNCNLSDGWFIGTILASCHRPLCGLTCGFLCTCPRVFFSTSAYLYKPNRSTVRVRLCASPGAAESNWYKCRHIFPADGCISASDSNDCSHVSRSLSDAALFNHISSPPSVTHSRCQGNHDHFT